MGRARPLPSTQPHASPVLGGTERTERGFGGLASYSRSCAPAGSEPVAIAHPRHAQFVVADFQGDNNASSAGISQQTPVVWKASLDAESAGALEEALNALDKLPAPQYCAYRVIVTTQIAAS
jgi:hypothetical protein